MCILFVFFFILNDSHVSAHHISREKHLWQNHFEYAMLFVVLKVKLVERGLKRLLFI